MGLLIRRIVVLGVLVLVGCREEAAPAAPGAAARSDAAARPDAARPDPARPRDAAPPAPDAEPDGGDDDAAPFKIVAMAPRFEIEITIPDVGVEAEPPPKRRPKAKPGAPARPARPASAASRREPGALSTIRSNMRDVEDCYGRVALKDPSIRGRIVMQWTLGRDGIPTGTAVLQDTLKDKSVSACIKQRARAWKFPAPSGGVGVITYPFDLEVR